MIDVMDIDNEHPPELELEYLVVQALLRDMQEAPTRAAAAAAAQRSTPERFPNLDHLPGVASRRKVAKESQAVGFTEGCEWCAEGSSPVWRAGPSGKGTLCNACGLQFQKGMAMEEARAAIRKPRGNWIPN